MALPLFYRISCDKNDLPLASSDVVLNRPLTMLEIDANMKTIDDAFEGNDSSHEDLLNQINLRAPITNPLLKGILGLPRYLNQKSLPKQIAVNGETVQTPIGAMAFADQENSAAIVVEDGYGGTTWSLISTLTTMEGFVKKTGDTMTGDLTGQGSHWQNHVYALPPDKEIGEADSKLDVVATVNWVKSTVTTIVEERLTGGSGGGGIIIQDGDLTINNGNITIDGTVSAGKLFGDIDLGIL